LTKRSHIGCEEGSSVRTSYKQAGLVVINHGVFLDLDGKYQLLTSNVPIGEVIKRFFGVRFMLTLFCDPIFYIGAVP
jgi:hypothetical protein